MIDISVETIPHRLQRYDTVGDWQFYKAFPTNFFVSVAVSDMGNSDYEFLVGIHELIEAYLCQKRGIKEEDVTAFDIKYEENRRPDHYDEPGDDPDAPYFREHQTATRIERDLARELGVDWDLYDKTVNEL